MHSFVDMLTIEVLEHYPTQWYNLLSSLDSIDLLYAHLITFNLDWLDPHLLSLTSSQVPFLIKKFVIHLHVINEGESTCMMSSNI